MVKKNEEITNVRVDHRRFTSDIKAQRPSTSQPAKPKSIFSLFNYRDKKADEQTKNGGMTYI